MNVALSRYMEQFIRELIASGKYSNASEVVREAMRLLIEREEVKEIERDKRERKRKSKKAQ